MEDQATCTYVFHLERRLIGNVQGITYDDIFTKTTPLGVNLDQFKDYLEKLPWINTYNKDHSLRLQTCWLTMGGCQCPYKYGRNKPYKPAPFPEWLISITSRIKDLCNLNGYYLNSVNANRYDTGAQGLWWHSDDEAIFKAKNQNNITIVSLSIGGQRDFKIKRKFGRLNDDNCKSVPLRSGDLLIMTGQMQDNWLHMVPFSDSLSTRFNLTFRFLSNHMSGCPYFSRRKPPLPSFTGICFPPGILRKS